MVGVACCGPSDMHIKISSFLARERERPAKKLEKLEIFHFIFIINVSIYEKEKKKKKKIMQ